MRSNHGQRLRLPSERVGTLAHAALPPPRGPASREESLLVGALRGRDERAFASLLDRFYSPMLRLAETYVRSREEAEEVVQDTWLAVLAGLDRFEGRSSLKTWIYRILVNRARTRARREARLLPLSQLRRPPSPDAPDPDTHDLDWLVASARLEPPAWHARAWTPPSPEDEVLEQELHERIRAAIRALPRRQQEVISLRDVEGWTAGEVCNLLDLSEANQRVLLHRARVGVRDALESYLTPVDAL